MTRGETRKAIGGLATALRGLLRLRWVRLLTLLLLIAFGLRLSLNALLAGTVRRLASVGELECVWEDLDLSLFGGEGTLRGLRVVSLPEELGEEERAAARSAPALIEVEYATFDLEVLALLRGELRVRRAEVDGFDARLERDARGRWNIERHLALLASQSQATPEAQPDEEQDTRADEALDLSLPLEIEALRFQHAHISLLDLALGEPVELGCELNAALSHLGNPERPARFSATITGGKVLDGAQVEGELRSSADQFALELRAHSGGLRPAPLEPYLAFLGLRPAAESIEASCRLSLSVEVAGEARAALRTRATLSEVLLVADGSEALALDSLELGADHLGRDRATFAPLQLRSPRGRVELLADGALRAAGLDLVPGLAHEAARIRSKSLADRPTPEESPASSTAVVEAPVRTSTNEVLEPLPWSLAGVQVRGGGLQLVDHSTTPAVQLTLAIDTIELGEVAFTPGSAPTAVPLDLRLSSPGVAEKIHLGGNLQPIGPDRELQLELELSGMGLEAIDPYLSGAGIERAAEPGALRLRIAAESSTDDKGRTTAQLELGEIVLGAERELFGLQAIALREVVIDPNERLLRVGEMLVDGTRLDFERDLSDNFVGFGLRLLGRGAIERAESKPVASSTAPATEVESAAPARALRIELGRVAWTGSRVGFVDNASQPPTRLDLDELGFELENLVLGGQVGDDEAPPATFRARLVAQGMVEELALEGSIRSRPGPLDLEAALVLRGQELDGHRIAPYLSALGVEPLLTAGELRLDLDARVRQAEDGLRADLVLSDALLAQAGTPLLALKRLELADFVSADEGLSIGRLRVEEPVAWVRRDATGALELAGLRLMAPSELGEEPPENPSEQEAQEPTPLELPALPSLRVDELVVEGFGLVFDDASFEPELSLGLALDFSARGLNTLGEASDYELRLSLADALEELALRGALRVGRGRLSLDGTLSSYGLRAGPLERFLPEGLTLECEQGHLDARFALSVEPAEAGGLSALLRMDEARWSEPQAEAWFALREAHFELRRFDPLAEHIELGRLVVAGATISARRDDQGVLHAFGVALGAPSSELSAEVGQLGVPLEASAPRAAEEVATAAPAPTPPPHLELAEGLSLELEALRFEDATLGADARALVASLRLELEAGQVLDPLPTEFAPLRWSVGGDVEGLVGDWQLSGSVAPFADEPRLEAHFVAEGLRTAGACELVPALGELLEGELEDGRVSADLEATLSVRRSRPWELGLERAFSAQASLEQLHLRSAAGGEVLVGIDAVRIDAKRIDPGKGLVHLELLEVETPRLRVSKDAQALHALGFALPLTPAQSAAPTEVEESELAAEAPDAADEVSAAGFELTIDRLALTGLDVLVEDVSIEPPLHLPLDSLEAELRRFSTRKLKEPRPMPFDLYLGTSGAGSGHERPLFEELVATGRISLQPATVGRARLQISAFELTQLAGFGAAQGITVEDGAMDTDVRVELRGADGLGVDTALVFTDLGLMEPEGGLLERSLSLPMTIDAALFMLRNPAGEHRLSIDLDLGAEGLTTSELALAATGAIAEFLAVALAGAPLRLVTAFVPEAGGRGPLETDAALFEPGNTRLDAAELERLRAASRKLAGRDDYLVRLVHELGQEDLREAERLANPTPEDCLALTEHLRHRRRELTRRVESRQLEARALYAVGATEASGATEELRHLQRELSEVERSLDQVLEVLHSSSPRQRQKRARIKARELAQLRLEEVAGGLQAGLRGYDALRLELAPVRVREASLAGPSRVRIEFTRP